MVLYLKKLNTIDNCECEKSSCYGCRCNYEKVRIYIGREYKGEIEIDIHEEKEDSGYEYHVYIDGKYIPY